MKPKSVYWGHHTWQELHEIAKSGAVVVAPFGASEQHGPMLPVDTDIHIADKWAADGAKEASERFGIPTLVLPTVPFGLSAHHMRFAGTIAVDPETYVSLVAQVLSCVVKHGFRRIAVVSGHGGNDPGIALGIKKVINRDQEQVRIAFFEDHRDPEFQRLSARIFEDEPDQGQMAFHADRWETSETLADRPHLVVREGMVKPDLIHTSRPDWAFMTHQVSPTGASGDPSLARADLGEKLWPAWSEAVALFIKRLWEADLPE